MNWNMLLNNSRRKKKAKGKTPNSPAGFREEGSREEIERDYDRILFLAPTRRLADKTQVFPLEQNDSVRTRLTHSFEVSNLARSIGTQLAFKHSEIFNGHDLEQRDGRIERSIPSLLAAIGLAHDLGNPPFGHQGESAISNWFYTNAKYFPSDNPIFADFFNFDGNSQTIRLLTQLQILNDKFGINLTYATLAAMIKYPLSSKTIRDSKEEVESWKKDNPGKNLTEFPSKLPTWKKHGYFKSEEAIVNEIWEQTGLKEGVRHPLTYIMEACDDIAYSVLDAEDIVKKGLASFHDLINHLKHYLKCKKEQESKQFRDKEITEEEFGKKEIQNKLIDKVIENSVNKNNEYSEQDLTPAELNDISMQMFRVNAIHELVKSVTTAFIENQAILTNEEEPPKDLMSLSDGDGLCCALKLFDLKWGYKNKSVLKLELEGFSYIQGLMDMLWVGIHGHLSKTDKKKSDTPFGKYAYGRISENYRRVFEDENNKLPEEYKEAQLLTDAISGMTDSYLIALHDELKPLFTEGMRQA